MKLFQFSRFTWPYICLYLFFSAQLQELHTASTAPLGITNETHQTDDRHTYLLKPQHKKSISYSLATMPQGMDLRDFRKELGDLTK